MSLAIPANLYPSIGNPLNEVQISKFRCHGSFSKTAAKDWCGHTVTVIKNKVDAAVAAVGSFAETMIAGLGDLTLRTNEVAGVFRKLQKHTLTMVEYLSHSKDGFHKFSDVIKRYVSFIDFVQLAGDINYFVNAGWRAKVKFNENGSVDYDPADTKAVVAARVSMFAANIGGTLLWFEEMGFFSLSKAAAAVGNAKVFSFVPKVISSIPVLRDVAALGKVAKALGELRVFSFATKISPLFVTLRALDLMYAFFAIDAAQRLVKADNITKRISASLDLTSYVAELTLSAVVLAGATNIVGLGVMSVGCIGLALTAFFYRDSHRNELKPQLPANLIAKTV